jgi:hypothetical protein
MSGPRVLQIPAAGTEEVTFLRSGALTPGRNHRRSGFSHINTEIAVRSASGPAAGFGIRAHQIDFAEGLLGRPQLLVAENGLQSELNVGAQHEDAVEPFLSDPDTRGEKACGRPCSLFE